MGESEGTPEGKLSITHTVDINILYHGCIVRRGEEFHKARRMNKMSEEWDFLLQSGESLAFWLCCWRRILLAEVNVEADWKVGRAEESRCCGEGSANWQQCQSNCKTELTWSQRDVGISCCRSANHFFWAEISTGKLYFATDIVYSTWRNIEIHSFDVHLQLSGKYSRNCWHLVSTTSLSSDTHTGACVVEPKSDQSCRALEVVAYSWTFFARFRSPTLVFTLLHFPSTVMPEDCVANQLSCVFLPWIWYPVDFVPCIWITLTYLLII